MNGMIEHAFNYVEDVIFYIGKDNIRSQNAVKKISGVRITESKYEHLIKQSDIIFTYRIDKNNWRNFILPS